MEFGKYPAQPTCPALDVRRQVGNLENLFAFVSLSREDHLRSPYLCILNYQAQIGPVLSVLIFIHYFHNVLQRIVA